MKYIFIVLSIVVFTACSSKKTEMIKEAPSKVLSIKVDDNLTHNVSSDVIEKKSIKIYDLVNIPQEVSVFTKHIKERAPLYNIQNRYEKNYFLIWNIDRPKEDLNSIKWPFVSYYPKESYGENLQPLNQEFFDTMLKRANFNKYATINKKAVVLKETNIRSFPTTRPLFKDPSVAGEGFPFDYLQNSTIAANKPIFVSHYSKDGEWAYIFSSFAYGWIKTDEFVILNNKHVDQWQKAQQVRIVKEGFPIYSDDGKFLFKSKIGMMFALVSEDKETYTILTVSSYKNNKPLFMKSKISKIIASKDVLALNRDNLTNIIKEVSSTNYGWGGIYGQRDCSSMLRDLFAPFGIWLPRNSYQQSRIGKVISFNGMSDDEKIKLIKERAVPFQTLLYKKGHIVLYVGTYNDEVVVFHNTWGIKTKKDGIDGRVIIGKPIFSTLKLGRNLENYNEEAEMLRNLKTMNILTR